MPDLTPSERAHLSLWAKTCDPTPGSLILRLLDEADRLREGGDALLDAVTFWARRHAQALRWARAWKAAAHANRDAASVGMCVRCNLRTDTARAEADALRARVAELEGENAQLRLDTESAIRAQLIYVEELRGLPDDLQEAQRILERRNETRVEEALRPQTEFIKAVFDRLGLVDEPTPRERAEQDRDALRAFAARALRLLDRKWRVCPECRCLIWEDEPAPGPHAPDCALAALLREGEGLALDALPARDSSSAQ